MANPKKLFTREEVKNDKTSGQNLLIIHDKIYDLALFLNEHPGGEEVLIEQRGRDGSEKFDDVGHSADARELMVKYQVGELVEAEKSKTKPKEVDWTLKPKKDQRADDGLPYGLILAALVAIIAISSYLGLFP